jgi:hypothetical protein
MQILQKSKSHLKMLQNALGHDSHIVIQGYADFTKI